MTTTANPEATDMRQYLTVKDKWTGEEFDRVPVATAEEIDSVLTTADAAWKEDWNPRDRAAALNRAAENIIATRERIIAVLVAETGFTPTDAATEVDRGLVTLQLCAQEATRIKGEVVSLDASPGFEGRAAFTIRAPRGVVLAITPFNTPWNGALHKVGPALAAGNSVVLKPSEMTPASAVLLAEILRGAGVPEGRIHVIHGGAEVATALLRDERVAFTTFTGSTRVGTIVKQETGHRPVALELGSIAITFVCSDADLEKAANMIVQAGYRKSGQVCTSVQRVFVDETVADRLADLLAVRVAALRAGAPTAEGTQVGPVISEESAQRIISLVERTVEAGARLITGGAREGALVEPTLLVGVTDEAALAREEVFGPVVALSTFSAIEEAVQRANSTGFGLQAGVFTSSISTALWIGNHLRAGGLVMNSTSSTRADGMPFGGQNASGFGKEGPYYAIREMTVERLMMLG